MFKILFLVILLTPLDILAAFTFEALLSAAPTKQTLFYSGKKLMLGSFDLKITLHRETGNIMTVCSEQDVLVLGNTVLSAKINSKITLKNTRPTWTVHNEVIKKIMRFNYYYPDYYRYIRISDFQEMIEADPEGKIISPQDFKPEEHDIKNNKITLESKNTLIFDPNLILVSLPYMDASLIVELNKMNLIFSTMDHLVPFKLNILKEDEDSRSIEVKYQNKLADEMGFKFDKIIVDKKRKVLKKIAISESHVGSVYIELKKISTEN
jgi:hypothetical protein